MQPRSIEIVVGAFILAGVLSVAILAVRVSGFNVGNDLSTYRVLARFAQRSAYRVLLSAALSISVLIQKHSQRLSKSTLMLVLVKSVQTQPQRY